MANVVRKIVSGDKARFKDKHLDLELDLAYVTDNIIVMGFPAAGVEGLYRNRREDAKKFLDHRHGKNYWIFNFCPIRENSYPPSFFEGRVSRYPFPDHHVPPLAILPLFVREAREWLTGSSDRVAILHCKAGKGRSGTLACAYLLSLDETPSPPKLQRSMTKKERAKQRADLIAETVESEASDGEVQLTEETRIPERNEEAVGVHDDSDVGNLEQHGDLEPGSEHKDNVRNKSNGRLFTLEDVLALHTARRMKLPFSQNEKPKQGVSIPSQRRWLYYWSLLLADAAPRGIWQTSFPRVRLREIRVQTHDIGKVKMALLNVVNHLMEKTNSAKYGAQGRGRGPFWVSLARYNDELVQLLEEWEKRTRPEEGNMGKRRKCSDYSPKGVALREIFAEGKWDTNKMIRSFARLGDTDGSSEKHETGGGRVVTHTLRPLTDKKWEVLEEEMRETLSEQSHGQESLSASGSGLASQDISMASSVTDLAEVREGTNVEAGVILDAVREVRAKLYMGQVPLGWFWFIPAFHMPSPPTESLGDLPPSPTTVHFKLSRKDIDFHMGPGKALVDIDVAMEWVVPGTNAVTDKRGPLRPQTSENPAKGIGDEPVIGSGGLAAGIQAVVPGAAGKDAAEVMEANKQ